MAEYRDDLRAARMRIETLEAKLAERDAALRAREAEIAERDAALAALGQGPGRARGSALRRGLLLAVTHLVVGVVAAGAVARVARHRAEPAEEVAEGPVVEGRVPPPVPVPPMATAGGQAQGSGAGDLSSALEAALEAVRPQVRRCYADERKAHPTAQGFVRAVFEVGKDGRIGNVRLGAMTQYNEAWWSKDMAACVTRVLEAVTVPSQGAAAKGPTTGETSWFLMPEI